MTGKIKNMLKSTLLSTLMLINYNTFTKDNQKNQYLDEKVQSSLESVLENEKIDFNTISFEDALKFKPSQTYNTLIENAVNSDTRTSIDSVIKFVPVEHLKNYLNEKHSLTYDNNLQLNKLRVLTKTGEEVRQERFEIAQRGKNRATRSLKQYSKTLGSKLSQYGTEQNIKEFLDFYKEDIVKISEKYNLKPELLAGIYAGESGGLNYAFSNSGALGAFGLTRYVYNPTGDWFDGTKKEAINPFHTLQAMDRAADYLSGLIAKYKKFDDSKNTLALLAYNQGEEIVSNLISEARQEGLRTTKDILNYKKIQNLIEKSDKELHHHQNNYDIAEVLETPTYFLSKEGRDYPSKIHAHERVLKNYLAPQLVANNTSSNIYLN